MEELEILRNISDVEAKMLVDSNDNETYFNIYLEITRFKDEFSLNELKFLFYPHNMRPNKHHITDWYKQNQNNNDPFCINNT